MDCDLSTDVVVIGGGLAGLRAADAARAWGASVTVISKRPIGEAGATARASGGFAAAFTPDDSPNRHLADILAGGYGVCHHAQAERVANGAGEHLERLSSMAGGFAADEAGNLTGHKVPAHTVSRSAQFERGMPRLLKTLKNDLVSRGVAFLENHHASGWLRDGEDAIAGMEILSGKEIIRCRAGSVVLATGGCGQLFPVTSNGPDLTGDGYALALMAGATLRDMEFIQYTPTAFAAPHALKGQTIVGTLLTVEGVHLRNRAGERFMQRYDPQRLERADRATLARAIHQEISGGRGTQAGGVYLDATTLTPDEFERHRPGFYLACRANGLDPAREPLETAPSVHTCLGGIAGDANLQAAQNLFAAGEALGGTHGANRLSSNSLTEANVTGWLAGEAAAQNAEARRLVAGTLLADDPLQGLPCAGRGLSRDGLVELMGSAAGVARSGDVIEAALTAVRNGRSQVGGAPDMASLELRNMLLAAEAILASALARTESRGAHYREDFPQTDDANWSGNLFSRFVDGQVAPRFRPPQPSGSSRSK